jgi:dephospho-CoA kinase
MVNGTPDNLKKYTDQTEEELVSLMQRYPFYNLPKIALLLKKGTENKGFLKHVAITAYDRVRLEAILKRRPDFQKEK